MKRRSFLGMAVATPIALAISRIIDIDKLPPLPKPPVFTGRIGSFSNLRFVTSFDESERMQNAAAYVQQRNRYFHTRIGKPVQRYLPTPSRTEKLAAQEEFYAVMADAADADPNNWIAKL